MGRKYLIKAENRQKKFIEEEKIERTSFSVRFFDESDERILACFFTKMYDENKKLLPERKKLYDDLKEKYDGLIRWDQRNELLFRY